MINPVTSIAAGADQDDWERVGAASPKTTQAYGGARPTQPSREIVSR